MIRKTKRSNDQWKKLYTTYKRNYTELKLKNARNGIGTKKKLNLTAFKQSFTAVESAYGDQKSPNIMRRLVDYQTDYKIKKSSAKQLRNTFKELHKIPLRDIQAGKVTINISGKSLDVIQARDLLISKTNNSLRDSGLNSLARSKQIGMLFYGSN